MEEIINSLQENNLKNENNIIEEQQNNFLETTFGKTINVGLDIGLRALLPDFIENQIIDVKDTIIQEGFSEGINKAINSAINLGKSTIGIFTGNFENISQVQSAIKNGGIIDGISNVIDFVLDKTVKNGKIPNNIAYTIRKGKNVILKNISSNIENEFNKQIDNIEKLEKYSTNWKEYYNSHDFDGMAREYTKMKEKLKDLMPMENLLKEARIIENLHNLIKNNGKNFNLSEEEIKLANMLT